VQFVKTFEVSLMFEQKFIDVAMLDITCEENCFTINGMHCLRLVTKLS